MAAAASSTIRHSIRCSAGTQQHAAAATPCPPCTSFPQTHTLSNKQLFFPGPSPPHHRHVRASLSSTVDTAKFALWGTSFAGGHVLVVASDPEFKDHVAAVVTQVTE